MNLPEINIGLCGHVDHGKTSLVEALTGKWTAVHSEEIKRGITIKLGYADAVLRKCKCGHYTSKDKCEKCGKQTEALRMVSFVDAPGHETLMAIMISGASIVDAAILMAAADEACPQPQTREHLMALQILGIKNIIVIQNKIDLVSKEDAEKHYATLKSFLDKELAFDIPIIPISAIRHINIDYVIEAIEECFKTPERKKGENPTLLVVRSFDVNKPGADIKDLKGGVIGGAVVRGEFEAGKEIEILPGLRTEERNQVVWKPIKTKLISIVSGKQFIDKKGCGGLVAFSTLLDPSVTKSDSLVGSVASYPGEGFRVWDNIKMKLTLFDKVVGLRGDIAVAPIQIHEPLMINSGTATSLGFVQQGGKEIIIRLKKPICAAAKSKVALSRQIQSRWHLIGWGEIIA